MRDAQVSTYQPEKGKDTLVPSALPAQECTPSRRLMASSVLYSLEFLPSIGAPDPSSHPPPALRNITAIGECIYCGKRDNLTTEHVVPRGMRGTVTLPKGSCTGCASVTRHIETYCMRHSLLHVRIKYGLQRHEKARPRTLPVTFTDVLGIEIVRHVTIILVPLIWIMPVYEYPGLLLGLQPAQTRYGIVYSHIQGIV